ncbi:MAG TPA: PH domain-containing protein [Thermomicrobiales bacterium]
MTVSPPPRERLDPRALRLWRLSDAIEAVVFVAIVAAVLIGLAVWRDWSKVLVAALIALAAIAATATVIWGPLLRWRNWRYEVRDQEVDLQHGVWTITRVRVPMARIQHVDIRRGPLERRYGLATVVLFTAAGAHAIPGLALEVADQLRDRIAALANTRDDV